MLANTPLSPQAITGSSPDGGTMISNCFPLGGRKKEKKNGCEGEGGGGVCGTQQIDLKLTESSLFDGLLLKKWLNMMESYISGWTAEQGADTRHPFSEGWDTFK